MEDALEGKCPLWKSCWAKAEAMWNGKPRARSGESAVMREGWRSWLKSEKGYE
jgi:hypothetical protein